MHRNVPALAAFACATIAALWSAEVTAQTLVERGRSVAERVCAECHPVGSAATGRPRQGPASFAAIANTPGMTAMALTIWLETPHRDMPHLLLERDEREAVVAYITSLKRTP
jgi:mono/diheme cytochrome c family protein